MHSLTKLLIALNVVGGTAVLASYVLGLRGSEGLGQALWGGVPESARSLYTVNMFLAAFGYFPFTYYIVFKLSPESANVAGRFGYGLFILLYFLVLIPSALWLPLTAYVLENPSALAWAAVRIDLALVGLGSVGLLFCVLTTPSDASLARILAVIGLLPFCLQTAVLDGIIWPAMFKLPGS